MITNAVWNSRAHAQIEKSTPREKMSAEVDGKGWEDGKSSDRVFPDCSRSEGVVFPPNFGKKGIIPSLIQNHPSAFFANVTSYVVHAFFDLETVSGASY